MTLRYDRAPMMAYWEVTQACGLTCRHCRADAVPHRDPRELSTEEGEQLLGALASFGEKPVHLVLTGGDPLRRPDIYHLISHAVDLGLIVSVTPSGTPLLTWEAIAHLRAAGVRSLAFSLDGSTAERHDSIRGVAGTFARTVTAIRWSLEQSLPVQVNTLVSSETAPDLAQTYGLVSGLGAQRWAVFFLIATGRGGTLTEVTPDESEAILEWLSDCSERQPPVIKTTEAHHIRRIDALKHGRSTAVKQAWGVRDGAGIMFISHRGEIYPSGFLPIRTGNIRRDDPVAVYRKASIFRSLRDAEALKGKCGRCEFRVICGGSRARAYAASGDPLESDPLCPYEPGQKRPVVGGDVESTRPAAAGRSG